MQYPKHVLSKTIEGNHFLTFKSNINIETTFTIKSVGDLVSTMELYIDKDATDERFPHRNGRGDIEWCVDELNFYVCIGCWWENGELVEYDGVYSFPKEAGVLLKAFGVRVPKDMY